jgi:hypothetical protein
MVDPCPRAVGIEVLNEVRELALLLQQLVVLVRRVQPALLLAQVHAHPLHPGAVTWVGVSGFGRIRSRVGFGWIRVDSEQLRRGRFCGISLSVWAF